MDWIKQHLFSPFLSGTFSHYVYFIGPKSSYLVVIAPARAPSAETESDITAIVGCAPRIWLIIKREKKWTYLYIIHYHSINMSTCVYIYIQIYILLLLLLLLLLLFLLLLLLLLLVVIIIVNVFSNVVSIWSREQKTQSVAESRSWKDRATRVPTLAAGGVSATRWKNVSHYSYGLCQSQLFSRSINWMCSLIL